MHSSCMSEVFWEVLETFVQLRGHLFETFRSDLTTERAELYSAAIHDKGAPLENCIGFLTAQRSRIAGRVVQPSISVSATLAIKGFTV